jgi:dephospho-CoA kinase
MTKIIGLTGGIGSGKTTIGKHFQSLGVPVYIADDAAKGITESPEVLSQIKKTFGASIFDKGKLNRKALGAVVFSDAKKLKQLNAIIHPAVRLHFFEWVKQHANHPFVIKEAAILFESGGHVDCDYIITVVASKEVRIKRAMDRDNITRKTVLERIENQWSDDERTSKSDFVIENINLQEAKKQAVEILKKITNPQN